MKNYGKKKYFNDTICELLRQPGKEFTLIRKENGEWGFRQVAYKKHKVEGNVIRNGDNHISFACVGPEGINSRVQVTVISEGNSL